MSAFIHRSLAEIDHESERKKAKEQEEAKLSSGSTGLSSVAPMPPEDQSSPSVRELMRQREDTPSRKRLREQVQKTVGENDLIPLILY